MIRIFGVVGQDVHSKDIIPQIQAEKGEEIDVLISSPGGSVFDGFAIYDALKMSGKIINVSIMGQAASIASVIAMAGDSIDMGEGAFLMIHNSLSGQGGNANELEKKIDSLKNFDKRMVAIYKAKSGLPEDEITKMMSKETFMNADEAKNYGFITGTKKDLKLVALATSTTKTQTERSKVEKEEEKEVSEGFLAKIGKHFGLTPKNIKAEGEEPPAEKKEDETAKAMDEKDKEIEALKAQISAMEEKGKESDTAKAEEEEKTEAQAKAKADLVFSAMQENKITLAQGKEYFAKSMDEVEKLKDIEANASGYGSKGEPNKEPASSKYDEWKALSEGDQFAFYQKHENEIINEMEKAKA